MKRIQGGEKAEMCKENQREITGKEAQRKREREIDRVRERERERERERQ